MRASTKAAAIKEPKTTEIALGYTVTLADQAVAAKELGTSSGSDGNGDLIRAMEKTPLAALERRSVGAMDHVHLTRYDRTDYVQWIGRKADGMHYPFGNIMLLIRVRGS